MPASNNWIAGASCIACRFIVDGVTACCTFPLITYACSVTPFGPHDKNARIWADELRGVVWGGSYEVREGAFSCYVDAVMQTLAASSYEGTLPLDLDRHPLDLVYRVMQDMRGAA